MSNRFFKNKLLLRGLAVLLGVFLLLAASGGLLFVWGWNDTVTYQEDAVIVLGCGVDGTEPSEQLRCRLDTAIEYCQQNPSVPVIVSGGQGTDENDTEAAVMARYLAAGVSNGAAGSKRLYLELGCGKGKFINTHALKDPDAYFLGIEGLDAVLVRGLERAAGNCIANLRFVMAYVADIRDFFADGELDGIYLNFSDPWPKPRHEKRRFTYGETLLKYRQILKPGGFVAFKTDNEDLFTFTLEEIHRWNLTIAEMSRDLHAPGCTLPAKAITTEYEDKFRGKGKNINYVKIVF